MHIGLVPFQRRRIQGQLCYQPYFLQLQDEKAVTQAINYMEERIGQPFTNIVFEELMGFFQKPKIARALFEVLLSRFYSSSGSLTENNTLSPVNRLKFWEFVAQYSKNHPRTFDHPDKLLKKFLNKIELSLSTSEAKRLLFADHQDYRFLTRLTNDKESASRIIQVTNTEMLAAIFRGAFEVTFYITDSLPGSLSRRLLFLSRRRGVYLEFEQTETFIIRLIGPNELVGRRTKYGLALSQFTLEILGFLQEQKKEFTFLVQYENYGQERQMMFSSSEIPFLDRHPLDLNTRFDSEVERQFFTEFSAITSPWLIEREPKTLVIDKKLFIPDFGFVYRQTLVLLEIVGFWTEPYLDKKINRLTQLAQSPQKEIPLILLVDNSLQFPSLPFPIFKYDNKFPVGDILNLLEEKYRKKEFNLYLSETSSQTEKIINELVKEISQDGGYLPEKKLRELLNVFSKKELELILNQLSSEELFTSSGLKIIFPIGVFSIDKIQKIEKLLEKLFIDKKTLDLAQVKEKLKDQLPAVSIVTLLEYFGYEVQFKNLMDRVVRKKGS
jgi:predicted nuclease of restriction endonuclease-like RecB superfamily